jgi:hypothetical protein
VRKHASDAVTWLAHEAAHPTANRAGLCLQTSRLAWGLPVMAPSANALWAKVPAHERHHTPIKDVPRGAFCFGLFTHKFGHVWVADQHGYGYSIDYKRHGRVDRVPLNLPSWTHDAKVFWTDWTPLGRIPVG